MQSEFSPPSTQLDAVLWFLRVQLWLLVVVLLWGTASPSRGGSGLFSFPSLPTLIISGLPLLILWLFPRPLAFASLGSSALDPLVLRPLLGRCIGLSLFVHSLGNAVFLSLELAETFYNRGSLSLGSGYSTLYFSSPFLGSTVISFFLGFFLAFGSAIRDNLHRE